MNKEFAPCWFIDLLLPKFPPSQYYKWYTELENYCKLDNIECSQDTFVDLVDSEELPKNIRFLVNQRNFADWAGYPAGRAKRRKRLNE